MVNKLGSSIIAATLLLSLTACEDEPILVETSEEGSTVIVEAVSTADPTTTVCDPFANNPTHLGFGRDHGIAAKLSYLPTGTTRPNTIAGFLDISTKVDATLFFDQVNIPTRAFDQGFVTQAGATLTDQDGDKLYEDFAVEMETQIKLTDNDAEGDYQFALLADDGAVMKIDRGAGYELWVNDDGVHATKAMGSLQPVTLTRGSKLPVQIHYYQGPRYHIALVLLWRPVPQAGDTTRPFIDPAFGTSGNTLFFDSSQSPSVPKSGYLNMVGRGWQIVPAQNFVLPESIASNPCVPAYTPPVGVSETCALNATFTPKSQIKVGLSVGTGDPSITGTVTGLTNMGFAPTVYNDAQVAAGQPATDGVTALLISRVVMSQPTTPAYVDGVKAYVAQGGSLIGEYDGAALFFSDFTGAHPIIPNFTPSLNFFTGTISGGGALFPVQNSTIYVSDPNDPLMQGVSPSVAPGPLSAFAATGFNSTWLHTSATYNSSGATNVPLGTYPAVLSGQCGQGRVVLFTATTVNRLGNTSMSRMVSNAIHWVTGL